MLEQEFQGHEAPHQEDAEDQGQFVEMAVNQVLHRFAEPCQQESHEEEAGRSTDGRGQDEG